MTPGPLVFDRVMETLRKEKTPRGIWLWLLFPVLILAGTAVTLYQFGQPGTTPVMANTQVETQTTSSISGPLANLQEEVVPSGDHTVSPVNKEQEPVTHLSDHEEHRTVAPHPDDHHTAGSDISAHRNSANQRTGNDPTQETRTTTHTTESDLTNHTSATTTDQQTSVNNSTPTGFRPLIAGMQFEPSGSGTIRKNGPGFNRKTFELHPLPRLMTKAPDRFYHFSVGAYLRIGATASHFDTSGSGGINTASTETYTTTRSQNDKFTFSYSTGITFRYRPVRFLAIETGVGFNNFTSNEAILDNTGSALDITTFPDTTNFIATGIGTYKEYLNAYSYISIPVHLYFNYDWKWIGVEAGLGASIEVPVFTASYEFDQSSNLMVMRHSVSDSYLNNVGIVGEGKVHAVFHSGRLSFYAGPVFRYRFNSMFRSGYPTQQYPYFIGGETGLRVNF